jgi:hypothetical protein
MSEAGSSLQTTERQTIPRLSASASITVIVHFITLFSLTFFVRSTLKNA